MLSFDLLALKTWFDAVRHGQYEFSAAGAEAFSDALHKACLRAVELERAAGPAASGKDLLTKWEAARVAATQKEVAEIFASDDAAVSSDNVVPFRSRRVVPITDSDGDAA